MKRMKKKMTIYLQVEKGEKLKKEAEKTEKEVKNKEEAEKTKKVAEDKEKVDKNNIYIL